MMIQFESKIRKGKNKPLYGFRPFVYLFSLTVGEALLLHDSPIVNNRIYLYADAPKSPLSYFSFTK